MNDNLIEKLKQKRIELAAEFDTEIYKILHNSTIEEIAEKEPRNLDELSKIKGMGPKKIERFGQVILELMHDDQDGGVEKPESGETVYSVSGFLNRLDLVLRKESAKIRGEVNKVNLRETMVYFDLKDLKREGNLISCVISRYKYEIMGVEMEEGLEVVISGYPSLYKPFGKMNFRTESVELVGEGKLKKAYENLKRKLEKEGLFAEERKRPIPPFAGRIGLITSRDGEAMHDFTRNLESEGFSVEFFDSRVEGQRAVPGLIGAIEWFSKNSRAEVLVITRGGGSWESLQAFNNEAVVRAIAGCRIPVLVGIGHERDTTIACLVADKSVSTPSITARFLSRPRENARNRVRRLENSLINSFEKQRVELNSRVYDFKNSLANHFAGWHRRLENKISESDRRITHSFEIILEKNKGRIGVLHEKVKSNFSAICRRLPELTKKMNTSVDIMLATIERNKREVCQRRQNLCTSFTSCFNRMKERVQMMETILQDKNPTKLLKLGYSLVYRDGKIIKYSKDLKVGQRLRIRFHGGSADSEVKNINDN